MTSTQETLPSNSKHLAEFQRYAERLATLGADVATLATAVEFLTYCDVETLQSLLENLQIRYRAVLTLSHESTHDIAHTLFLLSQEMVLWMTIVQAELGKKAFDSYRSLLQTGELLTIPVESIPGKIQDFLLALQAHSEVEHTIPLVHLGGKQDAEQTAFDMANGTIGHTAGDCAKRFSTAEMPQVPLQIICVPPNQLLRPIAQAFAREQQVAQQNHFFEMPHSSSRILYKFWTEQILALIEQLPGTHSVDDAADILGLLGDDHIEVLQAYLLNDPGAAERNYTILADYTLALIIELVDENPSEELKQLIAEKIPGLMRSVALALHSEYTQLRDKNALEAATNTNPSLFYQLYAWLSSWANKLDSAKK